MIFFLYTTESKLQANLHPRSPRRRRRSASPGAEPSLQGTEPLLLPAPATPACAEPLRAPGEAVPRVSPSFSTDTFLHSSGDNPSMQKFMSSPLTDGRSSFGSPGNVAHKGRGHRHQNAAALPLRSGSSSDCSKIQLNLRVWH